MFIMSHSPIGICEVPDISLLPNREERRKFRSARYSHTFTEEIVRIDIGGKTVKNTARSGGTDNKNTDDLFGEFEKGIRYDQLPPIVVKIGDTYYLIDGFTRIRALKRRGQVSWAFDVYEMNDGYTIEDLRDEIGLGANNHAKCKAASKDDFKTRASAWVQRQGRVVSKEEAKDWINSIPHTFTQKEVAAMAKTVIDNAYASTTLTSFDSNEAAAYLLSEGYKVDGKEDSDGLVGRLVCAQPNGTYGPRNFCHMLKDVAEGKRSRINMYLPSGKKIADPAKLISDQKEEFETLWNAVKECVVLLKHNPDWTPFEFGVRPSQILDKDPDGGVVSL